MRPAHSFSALLSLGIILGGSAVAAPLQVVATTSVLEDLVKNVGGDKVAVTSLVGPDGDAHTYEPTPSDAKAISTANVMVINGFGLEGWLTRLMQSSHFSGTSVTATNGIHSLTMEEEHPGTSGKAQKIQDPHAWQSLANGQIYVANIAKGLSDADPADAAYFQQNAQTYAKRLADLDAKVRAELADVPAAKRRVITTHDAFQYYGRAYGVEFIAPIGLSTEDGEPSAGDVAKLERQIKKQKIRALFLENVSNSRIVEQLANDTGAIVGPPLFSDALSRADEPAATYIQMFEYNTATLKAGMLKN